MNEFLILVWCLMVALGVFVGVAIGRMVERRALNDFAIDLEEEAKTLHAERQELTEKRLLAARLVAAGIEQSSNPVTALHMAGWRN